VVNPVHDQKMVPEFDVLEDVKFYGAILNVPSFLLMGCRCTLYSKQKRSLSGDCISINYRTPDHWWLDECNRERGLDLKMVMGKWQDLPLKMTAAARVVQRSFHSRKRLLFFQRSDNEVCYNWMVSIGGMPYKVIGVSVESCGLIHDNVNVSCYLVTFHLTL